MRLRQKIIVLAILPVVASVLAIAALVAYQSRELARLEAELLEESMLAAKRAELRHYVEMAQTSIQHIYESERDDALAREEVMRILSSMAYGTDGYFFAYDSKGNNLVHPRQPDLVGTNLWAVRDPQGVPVIQKLFEAARSGDGYLRYIWNKPSTGQPADKLSYVVELKRWGWMYGTGIYLDDVAAGTLRIKGQAASNITATLLGLAAVAVIATLAVFAGGLALNISEQRIADQQLKQLTQRLVSSQEEERARVARELHDGLSQLLVSVKFRFELAQERVQEGRANAGEAIDAGIAGLSEAINEIRRISHNLRPSLLDNLGLPAALEQLAEDFGRRTGIAIHAGIGPMPELAVGSATTSLFRVAQEALANVERHAHAQQVELTLDCENEHLRLSIRDDGLGLSATGPLNKGIGLRNMRERVEHHGGFLQVEQGSEVGGTLLIARIPMTAVTTEDTNEHA